MTHKALKILFTILPFLPVGSANAAEIFYKEMAKDGAIIVINGNITPGDYEKFRNISIKYRRGVVLLNSAGGALLPAIDIGKIIKITGYVTIVPDDAVCASSCALIWVAGSQRLLSPSGRVGFHASYRDNKGKQEESGVANALVGNYLTLLNLPEKAIIFATSAPPDNILWLTKHNKLGAGIDFEDFILDDPRTAAPRTAAPMSVQAPSSRQRPVDTPPTAVVPPLQAPSPPPASGGWGLFTGSNPATNTLFTSASVVASDGGGRLVVRCDTAAGAVVSVQFMPRVDPGATDRRSVSVKFDAAPATSSGWEFPGDGILNRDPAAVFTLVSGIAGARHIRILAADVTGAPLNATFDGPGGDALFRTVYLACGLPYAPPE